MARAPRDNEPGTFHVTTRGNRRAEIYTDDIDRKCFLELLGNVAKRYDWSCLLYTLMPNHYHLVIRTSSPTLSAGMEALNGGYSKWFNRRHGLEDHTFGRRFHSVRIEAPGHLLEVCRYIDQNAPRAGLSRHPSIWRWGSYRAIVGLETPRPFHRVDEVLALFGSSRRTARARFRAFVGDASTAR